MSRSESSCRIAEQSFERVCAGVGLFSGASTHERGVPAFWGPALAWIPGQSLPAAELVVVNANVITVQKTAPRAEAFAVSGGRFLAVGSTREVEPLVGKDTLALTLRTAPSFRASTTRTLTRARCIPRTRRWRPRSSAPSRFGRWMTSLRLFGARPRDAGRAAGYRAWLP